MSDEPAMGYLERVKQRAIELYNLSDQGEWDDLPAWMQETWTNAADQELRPTKNGN